MAAAMQCDPKKVFTTVGDNSNAMHWALCSSYKILDRPRILRVLSQFFDIVLGNKNGYACHYVGLVKCER